MKKHADLAKMARDSSKVVWSSHFAFSSLRSFADYNSSCPIPKMPCCYENYASLFSSVGTHLTMDVFFPPRCPKLLKKPWQGVPASTTRAKTLGMSGRRATQVTQVGAKIWRTSNLKNNRTTRAQSHRIKKNNRTTRERVEKKEKKWKPLQQELTWTYQLSLPAMDLPHFSRPFGRSYWMLPRVEIAVQPTVNVTRSRWDQTSK